MPHKVPEASRVYHQTYNRNHMDTEYHQDYAKTHRERFKEYARVRKARLKLEVLQAYGGAICACCGETHIEFLSIDHINGRGAAHRRELTGADSRHMVGATFYKWVKDHQFPLGFRVLCMNCNFALGHFSYCPHDNLPHVPRLALTKFLSA